MARSTIPETEDSVVKLLASLNYHKSRAAGLNRDERETFVLSGMARGFDPPCNEERVRTRLVQVQRQYSAENPRWFDGLLYYGSGCLENLNTSMCTSIETAVSGIEWKKGKDLCYTPRQLRSRLQIKQDSPSTPTRKRHASVAQSPSTKRIKTSHHGLPLGQRSQGRSAPSNCTVIRSRTPETEPFSTTPRPQESSTTARSLRASWQRKGRSHSASADLLTTDGTPTVLEAVDGSNTGIADQTSPLGDNTPEPASIEGESKHVHPFDKVREQRFRQLHALMRENEVLRTRIRSLEEAERIRSQERRNHANLASQLERGGEVTLVRLNDQRNEEIRTLRKHIDELRLLLSVTPGSKLASFASTSTDVREAYSNMRESIQQFAAKVAFSGKGLDAAREDQRAFHLLFRELIKEEQEESFFSLAARERYAISQAVLSSAIYTQVLLPELQAPAFVSGLLSDARRQLHSTMHDKAFLTAFDHATHRMVYDDPLFQQGYLDEEAKELANAFETSIVSFVAGKRIKPDSKLSLHSAFRHALSIKMLAITDIKQYMLFCPGPGAAFQKRSMIAEQPDDCEGKHDHTDAKTVAITVIPGILSRPIEPRFVEYSGFQVEDVLEGEQNHGDLGFEPFIPATVLLA